MTPAESKIASEQARALGIEKRDRKGVRWGKRARR